MTRFDVAFLAARLAVAIGFMTQFENIVLAFQMGISLLQFDGERSDLVFKVAIVLSFALALALLVALWFGAEWFAKRLVPKVNDQNASSASVEDWQNAALTVLGFYFLLNMIPTVASLISIPLSQKDLTAYASDIMIKAASVVIQLIAALVFVLIPHKLSRGLTRLRSAIASARAGDK